MRASRSIQTSLNLAPQGSSKGRESLTWERKNGAVLHNHMFSAEGFKVMD